MCTEVGLECEKHDRDVYHLRKERSTLPVPGREWKGNGKWCQITVSYHLQYFLGDHVKKEFFHAYKTICTHIEV